MKLVRRILLALLKKIYFLFSDKKFLEYRFYLEMGKKLDLKNPKTMNEKLQWLKLYNRKPEYTDMVDKIRVKDYVAKKIGDSVIIPTLAVWNNVGEINLDILPEKFVLKTNHGGGNLGVVICHDKSKFDLEQAKKKIDKNFNEDIYPLHKEYPYLGIRKKILAESLLETRDGSEIKDYKFYCFDGYVDSVMVCMDRQIGDAKFYFFDKDWNLKRYNKRGKEAPADFTLPKPENMDRMFEIASELSKGIPFLRVDLYNVDGKIYFGETTFFPASGFDPNYLEETDRYFGSKINLELCKK